MTYRIKCKACRKTSRYSTNDSVRYTKQAKFNGKVVTKIVYTWDCSKCGAEIDGERII